MYGAALALTYLALGDSPGHVLVAGISSLAISAIIAIGVLRRIRAGWAPRNLSLRSGLNRRERRAANRDIRRGEPNLDPTLLAVEVADAQVLASTYGWLGSAALVGTGFAGIVTGESADPWRLRVVAAVVLVGLAAGAGWCFSWWFCARRFLAGPHERRPRPY